MSLTGVFLYEDETTVCEKLYVDKDCLEKLENDILDIALFVERYGFTSNRRIKARKQLVGIYSFFPYCFAERVEVPFKFYKKFLSERKVHFRQPRFNCETHKS